MLHSCCIGAYQRMFPLVMDFLGLGSKEREKQETELERIQREQMIREANERFRPRL